MSQDSHRDAVDDDDDDGNEVNEITWVGDQRLMDGYCGRATTADQPASELRPVAVVKQARRSQGRVVRIGPPRSTQQRAA